MPVEITPGMKFSSWTVISKEGKSKGRSIMWNCRCDCGQKRAVQATSLRKGYSTNCGCVRREKFLAANTTHGHGRRNGHSPEFKTYKAMKARCYNPNNTEYHRYGGRGVNVCDRWLNDFDAFLDDMGPRPSSGHSIDRIDNDRGYSPDNCRWATAREQVLNSSVVKPVVRSDGREYACIADAASDTGVHPSGIGACARGLQSASGGYGWEYKNG